MNIEKLTDPEIVRMIAVEVMGWNENITAPHRPRLLQGTWIDSKGKEHSFGLNPLLSGDDMLAVIDAMYDRYGVSVAVVRCLKGSPNKYLSDTRTVFDVAQNKTYADTAQRAVCLASLQAIEKEQK